MARSIVIGVVGDSGAGMTTLTRVPGDAQVTSMSADDYRQQAAGPRSGSPRSTPTATTSTF